MTITLRDVARAAGVSPTTVSYVLNSKGHISEETALRVKQVIRELGYKRKGPIRGDVALVFADTRITAMKPALHQAAAELGFTLHEVRWDNTADTPPTFDHSQRVAGALVYGGVWRTGLLDGISRQVPTVFLGAPLITSNTDAVWIDYSAALYGATHRLLSQGHQVIGFINGPPTSYTSSEKCIGFLRAIRDFGHEAQYDVVEAQAFEPEAGRHAAAELFDRLPHLTAVISGDVSITHGLLAELQHRSLNAKNAISIISLEGDAALRKSEANIAIITLPMIEIAREAMACLILRLNQPGLPQRRILIRPTYAE